MGNSSAKDEPATHDSSTIGRRPSDVLSQIVEKCLGRSAGEQTKTLQLHVAHFKEIFEASEQLAENLYHHCVTRIRMEGTGAKGDDPQISREAFVSYGLYVLNLTNAHERSEWILSVFSTGENSVKQDFQALLSVCYTINVNMLRTAGLECSDTIIQKLFTSMEKSLFGTNSAVDKCDILSWCTRHSPRLLHCVYDYIHLTLSNPVNDSKDGVSMERGDEQAMAGSTSLLSLPVLWAMDTYTPSCYTTAASADVLAKHTMADILGNEGWKLLYDSSAQGLSLNRFKHHVMSYIAPTLSLIEFDGYLYCVGCDQEWSEKATRWGSHSCFLLQIQPEFKVILGGSQMIYFNIQDRKVPKGLQFGKDSRTTILEIDEDFATVKHYGIDVPLQRVEVWGCGSSKDLEKQRKQIDWEKQEALRNKDRKLKLDDWTDSPDRQILELGGVKTQHAER